MNKRPQIRRKWSKYLNPSFWKLQLLFVIFYLLERPWLILTIGFVFLFIIWQAFGIGLLFNSFLIFIVVMLLPRRGWKGVTRCGLQTNIGLSGLLFYLSLWLAIGWPSAVNWLWWCLTGLSLVSLIYNWLRLTLLLSREIDKLEDEIEDIKSRTAILELGGTWGGIDPVESAARELKTATNYDSAIDIFQQYPQPILSQAWSKLTNKQKAKVREWTRTYLSQKGKL